MHCPKCLLKQGVALTGHNTTGPPCSVGHSIPMDPADGACAQTVHAPAAGRRRFRQRQLTTIKTRANHIDD